MCKFFLGYALVVAFAGIAANADTITFTLNYDGCSGGCGTTPFGTITITDTTYEGLAAVYVDETLGANENYAGTGAGDALNFDVSGLAGAITVSDLPTGFATPGTGKGSAFGSFPDSVTCDGVTGGCHGGSGPTGPLTFYVTSTLGITTADFIANSDGYYFSSDILGNNGKTGNVAARIGTCIAGCGGGGGGGGEAPEPASLLLSIGGLALIGFVQHRRMVRT